MTNRRLIIGARRGGGRAGGGGSGPGGGSGGGSSGGLYGLSNFSAANFFATPGVGGEAGVNTGFGIVTLFQVTTLANFATNAPLADRSLGATGWVQYSGNSNVLVFGSANGSAGFVSAPSRTFVASDVGRIFLHIGLHTGPANFLRAYADRAELGAGAAIVGYTPASALQQLSRSAQFGSNFTPCTILGHAAFRGVPTLAQLQDYFDRVRARGDLPETMDGATVTHRWSARDELRGVPNPAGRKTYGARGFTSTANFSTATGLLGNASGFAIGVHIRPDRLTTAADGRLWNKGNTFNNGWGVQCVSGALRLNVFGSAGAADEKNSPAFTISAADVGRPLFALFVHDGSFLRTYVGAGEIGAGTAITGYASPGPAVQYIGRDNSGDASAFTFFGGVSGHVVPTLAQAKAWLAACEAAGRIQPFAGAEHLYDLTLDVGAGSSVPATILDRIGLDHLTRNGTLELAVDTATAPPAPSQLTDTVTRAPADALVRQGSPTVRIIDPSLDGRKTYGVLGHSLINYLQAQSAGIRGAATGLTLLVLVRIDALFASGAGRPIVHTFNDASSTGFSLYGASNAINIFYFPSAGRPIGPTLTAADVGRYMVVAVTWNGTNWAGYIDGAQQFSVAGSFAPTTTSAMRIGRSTIASSTEINDFCSTFAVAGCDEALTLSEIQQVQADYARTGKLVLPAGKINPHSYDITQDVISSGDLTRVPAVVLDRIGTDHLSRVDIDVRTDANSIRSVGPYGAADGWQTAPTMGVQGLDTGLNLEFDVWLKQVPTANEMLAHCTNSGGTTGWYLQATASALNFFVVTGGTAKQSGTYTITAGDLNKRLRLTCNMTGAVIQLHVQGVQAGADVTKGGTYTPNAATTAMTLGQFYGARNFSGYIELAQGGNVALAPADIATINSDLTQPAPIIAGKTEKRWRFEQDIATVNGALPARSVERIAGNDDLIRVGSPLVLAQRTERLWSYETSPILYGVQSLSTANFYTTAGIPTLVGSAAGFWVAVLLRIDTQAVASTTRLFAATMSPAANAGNAAGWYFTTNGTNSTLAFVPINTAGSGAASPLAVLGPGDVGKLLLVVGVHDGSRSRLYVKRAEQGTGTSITGYAPGTNPLNIGRDPRNQFPADGITVLGVAGGNAIPSLAEAQALHDAVLALEDITIIPGKTDFLVSVKRDTVGGVLPTQLKDRIGTDHMSVAGAPTLAPVYARAAGW